MRIKAENARISQETFLRKQQEKRDSDALNQRIAMERINREREEKRVREEINLRNFQAKQNEERIRKAEIGRVNLQSSLRSQNRPYSGEILPPPRANLGPLQYDEFGQPYRKVLSSPPEANISVTAPLAVASETKGLSTLRQVTDPKKQNNFSGVVPAYRVSLQVPKNSTVKFDGNFVSHSNGIIDMSWMDPSVEPQKIVKVEITHIEDGITRTLTTRILLPLNSFGEGNLDFTRDDIEPQITSLIKKEKIEIKTRDSYADELVSKGKNQLAVVQVWHSEFEQRLESQGREIEGWRESLKNILSAEPESVRTPLLREVDSIRDANRSALEKIQVLLAAEFERMKSIVEQASTKIISLRADGRTVAEVEKEWALSVSQAQPTAFTKASNELFIEISKNRSSFVFSERLNRERSVHNFVTVQTLQWMKNAESKVQAWKNEEQAKLLEQPRKDLLAFQRDQAMRLAAVSEQSIQAIARKHLDNETAARSRTILEIEEKINAEAARRLELNQKIKSAVEKNFKETLSVVDTQKITSQFDEEDTGLKEQYSTQINVRVSAERARQSSFVPTDNLVQLETAIFECRRMAQARVAAILENADLATKQLNGSKSELNQQWHQLQRTALGDLVERPVRWTIEGALKAEMKVRQAYETERESLIESFKNQQHEIFQAFPDRLANKRRTAPKDESEAAALQLEEKNYTQALESLKAKLLAQDQNEDLRRQKFPSIADQIRKEKARYPLAMRLPVGAERYLLAYELDEKTSLYWVDDRGERVLLASFGLDSLQDATAVGGNLALIAGSLLSLPAPLNLSENTLVTPAEFLKQQQCAILLFSEGKLVLIHMPELADSRYVRIWSGGGNEFFGNLKKDDEVFTFKFENDGSSVDVVGFQNPLKMEAGLFSKIEP